MQSYQDDRNRQWSAGLDGEYQPDRESLLYVAVKLNQVHNK